MWEIEKGVHTVVKDNTGAHRLKKADPLPIAFFKNGLLMKGYPFFPFNSEEGQVTLCPLKLFPFSRYLLENDGRYS